MVSKELKEKRRAQGLCVYCGRPAVIKADGTPARRCKECSGSHVYETAKSYCLKHVAHVFGAGQTINDEKITESLGDIAVYCIIMQHMVESNKQAAEKTKEYDHE